MTDARWAHVSPSQLHTHADCPSKWWWDKIAGLPRPGSKATALGGEIHAQLEQYLLHGTMPESPIARAGLRFLPVPPVAPELVEQEISYGAEGPLGIDVKGFVDLVEPENNRITDHKTTSAPRWAKTEEQLRDDPQCLLYLSAAAGQGYLDSARPMRFRHVYYLTKGRPRSWEVVVELSWADVVEGLEGLRDRVQRMRAHAAAAVEDVPIQTAACGKYGGCPYVYACKATHKLSASRMLAQ